MVYVNPIFLTKLCSKFFGGVRPEMRLSDADMQTLKPEVKRVYKSIRLRLFLYAGIFAVVAAAALGGRFLLESPSANALMDNRLFFRLMGAGLFTGLGLAFCFSSLQPIFARRAFADNGPLYDAYLATDSNWLPHRAAWFWGILCAPTITMGMVGILYLGERVDENGIDSSGFPVPRHHAYSDVKSVEFYTVFIAPIGPRNLPNLVVRFKDGLTFEYNNEQNRRDPDPMAVALYVSEHAKVPLSVGRTPP